MSSFVKQTKHPITGQWQDAAWIDDYFGHHNYGVKFADGNVFDPRHHTLETNDDEVAAASFEAFFNKPKGATQMQKENTTPKEDTKAKKSWFDRATDKLMDIFKKPWWGVLMFLMVFLGIASNVIYGFTTTDVENLQINNAIGWILGGLWFLLFKAADSRSDWLHKVMMREMKMNMALLEIFAKVAEEAVGTAKKAADKPKGKK